MRRGSALIAASAGGVGMRFDRFSFRTILFVMMMGLAAGHASAQSDRGSISGTILDSSGAVVSGAEVTATGAETGSTYKTVATSTGAYRFPDLQVGTYIIT